MYTLTTFGRSTIGPISRRTITPAQAAHLMEVGNPEPLYGPGPFGRSDAQRLFDGRWLLTPLKA